MLVNQKGSIPIFFVIVASILGFMATAYFLVLITGFNQHKSESTQLVTTSNTTVEASPTADPSESANTVTSTPTPILDNSIKFDVEKAAVGDKVGTMEITYLSGSKTDKPSANSAIVNFSGEVSLRGEIDYTKSGQIGEVVCISNFDTESEAKLPKLISQSYVELSFCFTNLELAKKLLIKDPDSDTQGNATVTINNYKIVWLPIEAYNTADLISVSEN